MSGGAGGTRIENLELGLLYAAMILSPKVCLGFAERPAKENKYKISKSFHTRFFFLEKHIYSRILPKCGNASHLVERSNNLNHLMSFAHIGNLQLR